jgi:hypothetical protein
MLAQDRIYLLDHAENERQARRNLMWELRKLNGVHDAMEPEGFYNA